MKLYSIKLAIPSVVATCIISCSLLVPPDSGDNTNIPWGKLSGRIIYGRMGDMGSSTLYEIDVAKRSIATLYTFNGDSPAWSFDGRFVLASQLGSGGKIGVYDLADSFYTVSFPNRHLYNGSWTANNTIACIAAHDSLFSPSYDLLIGDTVFLSNIHGEQPRTAFSHDGKCLVLAVTQTTAIFGNNINNSICRIQIADTSAIMINLASSSGEYFESPIFSPNDSEIAFIRVQVSPSYFRELWLMNADGSNAHPLTSGSWDFYPAFSPDGRKVMFNREANLYVINTDGTDFTQVNTIGGGGAAWSN